MVIVVCLLLHLHEKMNEAAARTCSSGFIVNRIKNCGIILTNARISLSLVILCSNESAIFTGS